MRRLLPLAIKHGVVAAELVAGAVDPDGAGSAEDDQKHVARVVGVLRDARARAPGEQGGVEVFAGQPPQRPLAARLREVVRTAVGAVLSSGHRGHPGRGRIDREPIYISAS